MRYLTERDHTLLQQLVCREMRDQSQRVVERALIHEYLAVASADIATRTSGTFSICKGTPPNFTHGNQIPNRVSDANGDLMFLTTGERFRYTTTTGDIPDELTAWNLYGCTIKEDTECLLTRVVARSSGGFWAAAPFVCQTNRINGTADSEIAFGDLDKTITVVYGDETLGSQQTVQYKMHNGGQISSGKSVTAVWWHSESAYVIDAADCES